MTKCRGILGTASVLALACASSALAQSVVAAGVPTREEVTPPPAPQVQPDRPRVKVEGDIERSPCPLADPAYANIRVNITSATFANLKGVTPEELRPAYESYLGADRPASAICDIRDAAATVLRRKGYLAAVQVPTQRIESGDVRFEVLFARVVAVRVRGDVGKNADLIASYLDKLTKDELFNRFTAERYLLNARDLPGMEVRLQLRPAGTGVGELVADVTIERTPFEANFNLQNLAGTDVGRVGGQLRADFYGLTGMGDRTTIGFYSTAQFKEQHILQLGHDMRLGSEGLTLSGRFTYAWTKPDLGSGGGSGSGSGIGARTLFATIEASYPIVRQQYRSLRGLAGFDFINQKINFGPSPLNQDRLRVLYLRLEGDGTEPIEQGLPRYRYGYTAELRQGIGVFDASRQSDAIAPSRLGGDARSTLVRGSAFGEVQLGGNLAFSLSARGQYAFVPLLGFEQFSGGSYTIGRGYDPGTIIGDSGIGGSAELKLNRWVPSAHLGLVLQPFVFVDSAWSWAKGAANSAQRLTSVGGGVRATIDDRARLDLTLAVPTNRAGLQTRRGDVRLLFSLTTKLWPWGNR